MNAWEVVKRLRSTSELVDLYITGDVAIALTDERGLDVPVNTTDNRDNTFKIDFEARSVGMYTCSVFFAEQEIPSSPYKIDVKPSIDIGKIHVENLESSKCRALYCPLVGEIWI